MTKARTVLEVSVLAVPLPAWPSRCPGWRVCFGELALLQIMHKVVAEDEALILQGSSCKVEVHAVLQGPCIN